MRGAEASWAVLGGMTTAVDAHRFEEKRTDGQQPLTRGPIVYKGSMPEGGARLLLAQDPPAGEWTGTQPSGS